jgi:hypothetical protein
MLNHVKAIMVPVPFDDRPKVPVHASTLALQLSLALFQVFEFIGHILLCV